MNQPSDEIKDRLDIVDVVQEYIQLKKAGSNYKANCPFHNEKTPSFMVSQEKQIWHCFGCGKGGDIFSFVQEMEGVEFTDALRSLAQKAGIQLKKQSPEALSRKANLENVLELAAEFFHQALLRSRAGASAREYLEERKISSDSIKQFRLGYAPNLWDALIKFLSKKGYREEDMFAAGLIIKREGQAGYYDRFRHRLIFPIADASGRIAGFGGRIMPGENEKEAAKYINSPQTQHYDKSKILYGLDRAKAEIRRQDHAVVVEGYLDVISSHQAGIKNAVAASGTALTLAQISIIKRYTENLVLAFDMDVAGDTAAKRGIEAAISSGINVKIAQLPDSMDPDDAIKKDVEIWQQAIKKAQSVMDFYFASAFRGLDLSRVEDKKKAAADLIPIIARIYNDVEKAHYLQKLAGRLNIEERILYDLLGKYRARAGSLDGIYRKTQKKSPPAKSLDSFESLTLQLMSYLFNFPDLIAGQINKIKSEILHDKYQELYNFLQKYYNAKREEFDYSEFIKTIRQENIKAAGLVDIVELYLQKDDLVSETGLEDARLDLNRIITNLKQKFLKNKMANLHQAMKDAEINNNERELEKLTAEFNQVSEQLSKLNL